jgi:hypothetical protein
MAAIRGVAYRNGSGSPERRSPPYSESRMSPCSLCVQIARISVIPVTSSRDILRDVYRWSLSLFGRHEGPRLQGTTRSLGPSNDQCAHEELRTEHQSSPCRSANYSYRPLSQQHGPIATREAGPICGACSLNDLLFESFFRAKLSVIEKL